MPIYEYEVTEGDCTDCGGHFEDLQSLHEPAHEQCPQCNKPCQRIFSVFYAKTWRTKSSTSSEKLEKKGFTQYKRVGKGKYEKSFGSGPKELKAE